MNRLKVLFLGARPLDAPPLRLKKQIEDMFFRLGQAGQLERIDLHTELTVSFGDLPNLLMGHAPEIVHITGHSSDERMLALEDSEGKLALVDPAALIETFAVEAMRRSIRCVVLNTCYSEETAAELSRHIEFVIGTQDEIPQNAAIAFAQAFYPVLTRGESLQDAFEVARAQFRAHVASAQAPLPTLYLRPGADPRAPLFRPAQPSPSPERVPAAELPQSVGRQRACAPRDPVPVFIVHVSDSSADRPLYEELRVFLRPLENQRRISCWDVTQLIPGEFVQVATLDRILKAQVVLLMISPDGVADASWLRLMDLALQRHVEGTARMMPILLRPTFTEGMPFAGMATLPGEDKAVTAFRDRSTAWNRVLKAVHHIIARLEPAPPAAAPPS